MGDKRDDFVRCGTRLDVDTGEPRVTANGNDLWAMGHAWERGLVTLVLLSILLAGVFGIIRPARAMMQQYSQALAGSQPTEHKE
jgi:hypothetical protein